MSIHARFFDTSKRHRRDRVFCLLTVLVSAVVPLVSGCIVADKIEFDDAVNHPVSIQRIAPEETIIERYTDVTFTVAVTDKDVTGADPAENPIAGLLEVQVDDWNAATRTEDGCSDPVPETPADTDAEGPPVYTVSCTLNLNAFDVGEDNLLQVRLIVSDLGFNNRQPVPGANTAEVLWILRVLEEVQ